MTAIVSEAPRETPLERARTGDGDAFAAIVADHEAMARLIAGRSVFR